MGLVETDRRKSIGALSSYPAEQELQKGCFQRSNRYHLAMCAYYHSNVSRCPRATGALELYRFAFSHHTHTKEDLVQTFVQRRSTLQ